MFHRASKHSLSDFDVYWFCPRFTIRFRDALRPVNVAADTQARMSLSLCDVTAAFTPLVVDNFQLSAIRAGLKRLAMLISGVARIRSIPRLIAFLESASLRSLKTVEYFQVPELTVRFRHCAGILQHGGGIA